MQNKVKIIKWREHADKESLYPFEKTRYYLKNALIQEIIHENGNYFSLFYDHEYLGNFKTLLLAKRKAEKKIMKSSNC